MGQCCGLVGRDLVFVVHRWSFWWLGLVGAVGWWVQSCVGSETFQFRLKGLSLQKKEGMIKEGV